jgi:hypothetical protein
MWEFIKALNTNRVLVTESTGSSAQHSPQVDRIGFVLAEAFDAESWTTEN